MVEAFGERIWRLFLSASHNPYGMAQTMERGLETLEAMSAKNEELQRFEQVLYSFYPNAKSRADLLLSYLRWQS